MARFQRAMRIALQQPPYFLNVALAYGFKERLLGLSLQSFPPRFNAVFFPQCTWVHTLTLNHAIHLLFLDDKGLVVEAHSDVSPGRFWLLARNPTAKHTLEIFSFHCPVLPWEEGMSIPELDQTLTPVKS